MREITLL